MKLVFAVLCSLVSLISHVTALKAAFGYELQFYYYVYKIEYLSAIPAVDRRLARHCVPWDPGEMCTFDKFATEILDPGKLRNYILRTKSFRTTTPEDSIIDQLTAVAPKNARIKANALSTTFPTGRSLTNYKQIFTDITSVLEAVQRAGKGTVTATDVDRAVKAASAVRKQRFQESYSYIKGHFISTAFGGALAGYLDYDDAARTINFQNSFNNVAAASGLTEDQKKDFKNAFRDATHGILTGAPSPTEHHWAIIGQINIFNNIARRYSRDIAASVAPVVPSTECKPVASSDGASGSKVRRNDDLRTRFEVENLGTKSQRRSPRMRIGNIATKDIFDVEHLVNSLAAM